MISDPFMVYNFAVSTEYSVVQAVIDEILEHGKLALIDFPEQTYDEDFADDTGFNYDSDKAEFVAGVLRQKSQLPSTLIAAATYTNNEDFNYGGGSLDGTIVGTVSIAGGYAVMTDPGIDYISKPAAGNVTPLTTKGTIIIRNFKPGWVGTPAGNRFVVDFGNVIDSKNRTYIYIDPAGTLRASLFNSAGVQIAALVKSGISWSIQDYELAFCWDLTPGSEFQGLYLQKSRVDNDSQSGTRDATMDTVHIGSSMTASADSNFSIGSVEFHDDCLFTGTSYAEQPALPETIYAETKADLPVFPYPFIGTIQNYTAFDASVVDEPHWTINNKYPVGGIWQTSNGTYAQSVATDDVDPFFGNLGVQANTTVSVIFPAGNTQNSVTSMSLEYTGQQYPTFGRIKPTAPIIAKTIEAIDFELVAQPAGTSVNVIWEVDAQLKWYNTVSEAWEDSDGSPAQSNTKADTNANVATLLDGAGGHTVYPAWVLITTDQQETPEIDTSEVGFLHGALDPDGGTLVKVFAYLKDPSKTPIVGATVTIAIHKHEQQYSEAGDQIISDLALAPKVSDAEGAVIFFLLRSSDYEAAGTEYILKSIVDANGKGLIRKNANNLINFTIQDGVSEINLTSRINAALAA
jgi:hypothetical protein